MSVKKCDLHKWYFTARKSRFQIEWDFTNRIRVNWFLLHYNREYNYLSANVLPRFVSSASFYFLIYTLYINIPFLSFMHSSLYVILILYPFFIVSFSIFLSFFLPTRVLFDRPPLIVWKFNNFLNSKTNKK